MKGFSIIVPFLNEEEAIPLFCEEMDQFVKKLEFPVEIIFVNDGSTDDSIKMIGQYRFVNIKRVKLLNLSKNFGAHAAIRAGLTQASYDICTWFGVDLQEPLQIIPIAYEKITAENFEAVYFEKRTVKVSKINRLFSKIYSKLMRKYAVKTYSSDGTATIAFGKKIKYLLNQNIESNSSLMLQIMNSGFTYDTITLDYLERTAGVSRWTLSKKVKLFIDSFVAFSFMPIRLVSVMGLIMFFAGLIIGIVTIINRLCNPVVPIGYSTLVSIMALGFGITNISLGIIAEYLWRTYDATRKRPVFIISDLVSIKEE